MCVLILLFISYDLRLETVTTKRKRENIWKAETMCSVRREEIVRKNWDRIRGTFDRGRYDLCRL